MGCGLTILLKLNRNSWIILKAGLLNLLYLVLRFFRTSTEGFILINQRCWIIIFTYDEIKKAVWDCGIDISPSHDGFSFGFIRRFWHLIDKDIIQAVVEFYSSIEFPYGCNTSFLVLIPKVQDAKNVKDFRPLSLIGCLYKIVGKILANGSSLVIKGFFSEEQYAFIEGRLILDGLVIMNEVLAWCKAKITTQFGGTF